MARNFLRMGSLSVVFLALCAASTVSAHCPGPFPQLERAIPQIQDGNRVINAETGKTIFMVLTGKRPNGTPSERESVVKRWLAGNYKQLGLSYAPTMDLVLRQDTPGGEVLRFLQTVKGVRAYQNDFVAQFNAQGDLFSVHQNLDDRMQLKSVTPSITSDEALQTGHETVAAWGVTGDNDPPQTTLTVICDSIGVTHLTYRVLVYPTNPYGEFEILVDAQSSASLHTKDLTEYVDGSGYIFDPDPLTTAQVPYTATGYGDNNNGDSPQFAAQRHLRTLRNITQNGGRDSLTGPWVKIADFESPTFAPVSATNPDSFRFARSNRYFDDVMVYAHIDSSQRWIQSLGFNNIQHGTISADAHGLNGQDNSHYVPGTNRLAYGEGGVDDDQDADVIWHEYGHAIQNSIVPGFGSSNEEGSMGEGFGDYWAGSYSRSISTFYDTWVYNFDGHNNFWDGRVLNDPSTYPWSGTGEIHTNGQIWSHALMDIDSLCGRTVANRLVLQGTFSVGLSATYVTFANSIMAADSLLYQKAHVMDIYTAFHARNILNTPPQIGILNGVVMTATGSTPVPGVVVILDHSAVHDTTDAAGAFSFASLTPSYHTLTVNYTGYNPVTDSVQVSATGVTINNIMLTRPLYSATPDSVFVTVGINDTSYVFSPLTTLHNDGDGPGNYQLGLFSGSAHLQSWSLVREIDVGQITGDNGLQGVEIFNGQIVLSGANGSNNPNKFYRLSLTDGQLLGTVDQPSVTFSGVRDLAALGNRLYGSENDSLWSWDTSLTNRQLVFHNTYVSPIRALGAQWSATNSPVFYLCDYAQPIRKLDNTGALISTYANTRHTAGIACGANANDPVWAVSTDSSQLWVSSVSGTSVTLVQQLSLPTGFSSAGSCIYNDTQTGNTEIGILLVSSALPAHAYLRFYILAIPVSYATLQIPATGALAANSTLNVPVRVALDTMQNLFSFHLRQTATPGITGLTTVIIQRSTSVRTLPNDALPKNFAVSKSYPNPFNSRTEVDVAVPHTGKVIAKIYDLTGRVVLERSEILSGGHHTLSFNFSGFATGMYFAEFRFDRSIVRQRLVYLK